MEDRPRTEAEISEKSEGIDFRALLFGLFIGLFLLKIGLQVGNIIGPICFGVGGVFAVVSTLAMLQDVIETAINKSKEGK